MNIQKTDEDIRARWELARKVIRLSGDYLKRSFGKELVDIESPYDTKLVQDRESEAIIVRTIQNMFPQDGFLAEESGKIDSSSGYTWIIDPLDGTVNYSRRIPHVCVSIACRDREKTLFGLVYDFIRDELFEGCSNCGAFLNEEKIKVSRTAAFERAVGGFGLMKGKKEIFEGIEIFNRLAKGLKKVRMFGAAALDLCYIACGRTDIFVELGLKDWDVAAGSIIVSEAGGTVEELQYCGMRLTVATNGIITQGMVYEKIKKEKD
jgi:myo-inositol-1(or 4)-monophosphatase